MPRYSRSTKVPAHPVAGPTGRAADARRGEIKKILLTGKRHRGPNVDQFATDIESVIDGLKAPSAPWIQELVDQGNISLKLATVDAFFPEHLRDKRRLERVRDGLTALAQVLNELPPEERQRLSHEAFVAVTANPDATSDVALMTVLNHVLNGVKGTVSLLSQATPPSDQSVQRLVKLMAIVATFHKHGEPMKLTEGSPFLQVCRIAGISRNTVKKYFPLLKNRGFDRLVADTFGP